MYWLKFAIKWAALVAVVGCICFAVYIGVGLSRGLDPFPRFGSRPHVVIITQITVIDVVNGQALLDRNVSIVGQTITDIGTGGRVSGAKDVTIIDGRGKYLIPGLWDAHVHTVELSDRLHFPLLRAYGVTTIRNMGDGCSWRDDLTCVPDTTYWAKSLSSQMDLMPKIVSTASYHIEKLSSNRDADRLVSAIKKRGDNMIKIQLEDNATVRDFKAIVEAAYRNRLQVSGHLPAAVNLWDRNFDALTSIEHDTQLLPHCETTPRHSTNTNVADQCTKLLAMLAKRGTAFVPTHVASSGQDVALLSGDVKQSGLLSYTTDLISLAWRGYRFAHVTGSDKQDIDRLRNQHRAALALTKKAHLAGVPVLAGTDALDAFVLHGVSLHDELEYLVRAGLTPGDALRSATYAPAKHFKLDRKIGQIAKGQQADLIILMHNPLADIRATRAIHTVFAKGVMYNAKDRKRLRAFSKRQAASHAVNARAWFAISGL